MAKQGLEHRTLQTKAQFVLLQVDYTIKIQLGHDQSDPGLPQQMLVLSSLLWKDVSVPKKHAWAALENKPELRQVVLFVQHMEQ